MPKLTKTLNFSSNVVKCSYYKKIVNFYAKQIMFIILSDLLKTCQHFQILILKKKVQAPLLTPDSSFRNRNLVLVDQCIAVSHFMNCALQCNVPFDATKMQLLMQEKFTVHISLSSFILFCILMPLFFLQNYRLATSYHSFFLLAIYHPLVVLNVQGGK